MLLLHLAALQCTCHPPKRQDHSPERKKETTYPIPRTNTPPHSQVKEAASRSKYLPALKYAQGSLLKKRESSSTMEEKKKKKEKKSLTPSPKNKAYSKGSTPQVHMLPLLFPALTWDQGGVEPGSAPLHSQTAPSCARRAAPRPRCGFHKNRRARECPGKGKGQENMEGNAKDDGPDNTAGNAKTECRHECGNTKPRGH